MATPVKIDNAIVNPRTGNERLTPVAGSKGKKFAAIFGTSGTNCHASAAPTNPARMLTSKLSKMKSRNTPARDAPSAMRSAISRRRPLKRTSKRFATLLHAISRTNATAANKVANAGRRFPVTSSGSVLRVMVEELSILPGFCVR